MTPKNTIIICATQRSGSTLVVEDFRNTKILGNPEEYYIPWRPAQSTIDWNDRQRKLIKRATGNTRTAAIKVMANQLNNIESCLNIGKTVDNGNLNRFYTLYETATWVYVKRQNFIKQAISREIAKQTGINHIVPAGTENYFAGNLLVGDNKEYNKAVRYNFKKLREHVTNITLENLKWEIFFKSKGIKPVILTYEIFKQDQEAKYLDKIIDAAGIAEKRASSSRKLMRLSNSVNNRWYKKFLSEI